MLVVAGPPGSGKSSILRPEDETDYFNADERARDLNKGHGQGISPEIRRVVNLALEAFISDRIRDGKSFSYETTLRTTITFEQARSAKQHGFETQMQYVALASAEDSIPRVRARAVQGGHSAPPERIREIYEASLRNLAQANQRIRTSCRSMTIATELSVRPQLVSWKVGKARSLPS